MTLDNGRGHDYMPDVNSSLLQNDDPTQGLIACVINVSLVLSGESAMTRSLCLVQHRPMLRTEDVIFFEQMHHFRR